MTPNQPKRNLKLSVILVFFCTLLGAAGQILMKNGTQAQQATGLVALLMAIFTNLTLFTGYALYGLSTALLVIALKYGELSILYPVIALTYVWVTGLSVFLYGEQLGVYKVVGLATVIAGVIVIGFGSRRKPA